MQGSSEALVYLTELGEEIIIALTSRKNYILNFTQFGVTSFMQDGVSMVLLRVSSSTKRVFPCHCGYLGGLNFWFQPLETI